MPGISPRLGSRPYSWPAVAVALLVGQAALSLTLKQGPALVAYCEITYFLLLLLATSVAAVNAVQSRQTIRLFWLFLAGAFGLWALVPCSWFYSVVLHGKIPTFLFDNPPLFLHIVLTIAAVASPPIYDYPRKGRIGPRSTFSSYSSFGSLPTPTSCFLTSTGPRRRP